MKRLVSFVATLMLTSLVSATSFSGLEHDIQFDDNSSQIRSEEIRSLIDWKINSVEMGGIDYEVFLYKDDQLGVGSNLVQKRSDAIVSFMNRAGIQITKVVIVDQQSKRRESGLSKKQTNTATIIFQPPCTKSHDCALQPITGGKPAEQSK